MQAESLFLLVLTGFAGGFLGGLLGIGGGVIFAPVLLVYYHALGVPDHVITPLTIGTSLLSVFITTTSNAWAQHQKQSLRWRIAIVAGLISAAAAIATTELITTKAWYDKQTFQLVFSMILTWVVVRTLSSAKREEVPEPLEEKRYGEMAWIGALSGVVSSLTGVGGGTILVPLYNRRLQLPIKVSTGTSSGTILFTSFFAVFTYLMQDTAKISVLPTAWGYIDAIAALALSIPAMWSARWGVEAAHRMNTQRLKQIFAAFCTLVICRLLYGVFG